MKTARSRHVGSAHENMTTADERAVIAQMSKLGSIAIDPAHVEVVVVLRREAARLRASVEAPDSGACQRCRSRNVRAAKILVVRGDRVVARDTRDQRMPTALDVGLDERAPRGSC